MNENDKEKKEYISRTLSRTHNKDYENYAITRIWHKLDNLDVKPVTQQYVSRPSRYALVDLYLPQLKMCIEIDEEAANPKRGDEESPTKDDIRERDIINLPDNLVVERIDARDNISLEELNEQCDKLVTKIQKRIEDLAGHFQPWDIVKENNPQTYIDNGKMSLKENVAFRTSKEACNCFGYNYKGFQRGGTNHPFKNNTHIWFPKLYKHGEWINEISEDGNEIIEKNIDKIKNAIHVEQTLRGERDVRIVFAYGKDSLGFVRYRFKGVFKLDRERTKNEQRRVWKKISDEVETFPPKAVADKKRKVKI